MRTPWLAFYSFLVIPFCFVLFFFLTLFSRDGSEKRERFLENTRTITTRVRCDSSDVRPLLRFRELATAERRPRTNVAQTGPRKCTSTGTTSLKPKRCKLINRTTGKSWKCLPKKIITVTVVRQESHAQSVRTLFLDIKKDVFHTFSCKFIDFFFLIVLLCPRGLH